MKIKLISNITFVISVKIKVFGRQEVEMINWNVIRNPGSALEYVTLQLIYWHHKDSEPDKCTLLWPFRCHFPSVFIYFPLPFFNFPSAILTHFTLLQFFITFPLALFLNILYFLSEFFTSFQHLLIFLQHSYIYFPLAFP